MIITILGLIFLFLLGCYPFIVGITLIGGLVYGYGGKMELLVSLVSFSISGAIWWLAFHLSPLHLSLVMS